MDSTKFPTIYDVTLAVHPRDGGPATISSILLGRKTVAEAYIRKYNLADVPKVQFLGIFKKNCILGNVLPFWLIFGYFRQFLPFEYFTW